MVRSLLERIDRLVFGPPLWPGPHDGVAFVRPRTVALETARRAAAALVRTGGSVTWEASGELITPDELAELSAELLGDVRISSEGAGLQLGAATPASVSFRDADSRDRAMRGLAVLERESRSRFATPRVRATAIVTAFALLALGVLISDYAVDLGLWAWLVAAVSAGVALVAATGEIARVRRPAVPSEPHRLLIRRPRHP